MKTKLILQILSLIALFSISGCKSFAQRMNYNDLNYVLYHDMEPTKDYLLAKGFAYSGIEYPDKENGISSSLFEKNPRSSKDYITLSKAFFDSTSYQVNYLTRLKDDYLSLKEEIQHLGFILDKTEDQNQSTLEHFQKDNLEIVIYSPVDKTLSEYSIYLTDITLFKKCMDSYTERKKSKLLKQ